MEVFTHTAHYESEEALVRLHIVVTFKKCYSIKMTRSWFCGRIANMTVPLPKPDTTYIENIKYLPKSILDMLSATGNVHGCKVKRIMDIISDVLDTVYKENEETEILSELQKDNEELCLQVRELQKANQELCRQMSVHRSVELDKTLNKILDAAIADTLYF